jgi:hypothetical protein
LDWRPYFLDDLGKEINEANDIENPELGLTYPYPHSGLAPPYQYGIGPEKKLSSI